MSDPSARAHVHVHGLKMADPSTLSNCLEVAVTSWHLSLDADFTTKKLTGAVILHGRVLADSLDRIVSELVV